MLPVEAVVEDVHVAYTEVRRLAGARDERKMFGGR
jgi:hypothetical protein